MWCIVNIFFLFICYRLVETGTIPLMENGTNKKSPDGRKLSVNYSSLPNAVHNPYQISNNDRYQPTVHNYQSSSNYNIPNHHNTYWPANSISSHIPTHNYQNSLQNHHPNYYNSYWPPNLLPAVNPTHNYESSLKYNHPVYHNPYWPPHLYSPHIPTNHQTQTALPSLQNINPYHAVEHIKPLQDLQADKQKSTIDGVKTPYPITKSHKTVTERSDEPPLNIKDILSKKPIRKHYISSQKHYMIIHPNGTVEDIDTLEPFIEKHPKYILVNGANIIPIKKETEREPHTAINPEVTPKLQANQSKYKNESPKSTIRVNDEKRIENPLPNYDKPVIVFPSVVSDSNNLVKSTPTTIIEINPQFIASSDNSVAKIQLKEEPIVTTAAGISEDTIKNADLVERDPKGIVSSNLSPSSIEELPSANAESKADISFNPFTGFEIDNTTSTLDQINNNNKTQIITKNPLDENVASSISNINLNPAETNTHLVDDSHNLFISSKLNETNEYTTEGSHVEKNQLPDKVSSIENDSGEILTKSTVVISDTNISPTYSEQKHLFDEIPLETVNESSFDNAPHPHNETSNYFKENKDIYTKKDSDPVTVNSTKNHNQDILNIMTSDGNLTKIANDYDLLTDQKIDESKPTIATAWVDAPNYTEEYDGTKSSKIDISVTSTIVTSTNDDADTNTTEKRNVYFKIDKDFWDKLKNKEIPFDVVYFFQVQDEPVIEKNIETVLYPDGTVATYETVRERKEDNEPILIKNIDVTNPVDV